MYTKNITYALDELHTVAHELKALVADCDVITFTGCLGAGKTTLIRALSQELGIQEDVTSPTFAYVHRYHDVVGKNYAHFDLYRLHTIDDFITMGFDEYFADTIVFIEWPAIVEPLLKGMRVCRIALEYDGLDKRVATVIKEL